MTKYKNQIRKIIRTLATNNTRAFIFGSSVTSKNFDDVDIGIIDKKLDEKIIAMIKNTLEESTIPYNIDIVHLDKANKSFQSKVLKDKKEWLIRKRN
jgi:predicted nucleotidyltransferase